jgi:hypothetical protein
VNNSLRVISLSFCGIGEDGGMAIAEGLEQNLGNSSVRYIDLEGNDISKELIAEIKRMIRGNQVAAATREKKRQQNQMEEENSRPSTARNKRVNDYLRNALAFRQQLKRNSESPTTHTRVICVAPAPGTEDDDYKKLQNLKSFQKELQDKDKKVHKMLQAKEAILEEQKWHLSKKEKEVKEKEKQLEEKEKQLEQQVKQWQLIQL